MTDDLDVDAMLEAPFKKEVSGIFFNCIFFFLFIITFQGNFWFLIFNFIYNYYCYLLTFIIFPVLVMKYVNLSVYSWSNYKKVTGKMKYQMLIELQDYIQCLFFAEQVYEQSFYIMTSMWFVCDF